MTNDIEQIIKVLKQASDNGAHTVLNLYQTRQLLKCLRQHQQPKSEDAKAALEVLDKKHTIWLSQKHCLDDGFINVIFSEEFKEEANTIRAALMQYQALLPDTHVVVPKEPSEGMLAHGHTAAVTANVYVAGKFENHKVKENVLMAALYRAMIKAAEQEQKEG